jgi:hypothetical protein
VAVVTAGTSADLWPTRPLLSQSDSADLSWPGDPPPASGQRCAVSGQGTSVEPPLTPLPDYCILVFMYT